MSPTKCRLCIAVLSCLVTVGCRHAATPCNYPGCGGCDPCESPPSPSLEQRLRELEAAREHYGQAKAERAVEPDDCEGFIAEFLAIDLPEAHVDAAHVANECAEPSRAIELYQDVVKRWPKVSADAYVNLGVLVWHSESVEKAGQYFERALEIDRGSIAANNNYGAFLRERYVATPTDDTYERAQVPMIRVLALDSTNQTAFENLARLHYDRGRLQVRGALLLGEETAKRGLEILRQSGRTSPDLERTLQLIQGELGQPPTSRSATPPVP